MTKQNLVIEGQRITLAREKRGYTKAELAERLEVSPRLVAAWESGERSPSDEQLTRIARVLQLLPAFFRRPSAAVAEREAVSFRSMRSLGSRQSQAAVATATFALELSELLDRDFALPSLKLPSLDGMEPEGAAISLRSHFGLGVEPMPNLVHLTESWGVRVFSLGLVGKEVSGMSLWHEGVPFIFLNTSTSGERGRFDVAHELGHLLLHRRALAAGINSEKEADRFASELLLPSESIDRQSLRSASVDVIISLAREWGVSAMMMVRRLSDLRKLREWETRGLYRQLSSMGFRRSEPQGMERETSQLLTKVYQAYRDEGATLTDIAKGLSWHASDLRAMLLGLVPSVYSDVVGTIEPSGASAGTLLDKPVLRLVQ